MYIGRFKYCKTEVVARSTFKAAVRAFLSEQKDGARLLDLFKDSDWNAILNQFDRDCDGNVCVFGYPSYLSFGPIENVVMIFVTSSVREKDWRSRKHG